MTSEAAPFSQHPAWLYGFLFVQLASIGTSQWWPGSAAHTIARWASFVYFVTWFGLKIRYGYGRRRHHWTRESWLRYLRLAAMPIAAITVFLLLSSIDTDSGLMGEPRSATRVVWILIMLTMMIAGVIGVIRAIDWLEKGEASEQFMRTHWFQRRDS